MQPPPLAQVPRASRVATNVHFFVGGLLFASWGVHVPTVRQQYDLTEAELSWLMLAAGLGSLIALTRVGNWVARHGARPVVLAAGLVLCLSLALLLHMPSYFAAMAVLFVFGLANGSFDVAMNAEAVAVETAYARPIMSSFHGFFSLGGMAGALLGSSVAAAGIAPVWHLAGVGVMCFASIWLAAGHMLPAEHTHAPEHADAPFRLPRGLLLLLGMLAAFGLIGEGAMYDWSTLYMVRVLDSPVAIAALAYGTFSAAMAAGRFGGDFVRARLGARRTLTLSAWLAALAMLAALAISQPWAALAGFALVGLGFSNIVPVLFSAAARVPGVPAANGIAAVSGAGYLGFMVGPPLIGFLAHHWGLGVGLLVVAVFAALVGALARRAMATMD
ncbi:MAG: MFS transporter [Rhodocyclaceae bacterium]